MKCQQCEKPATFHITELTSGQPQELHLCETCAKTYLTQGEAGSGAVAPTLANVLAKQLQIGKAAEELAKLDQRACPVCGITSRLLHHNASSRPEQLVEVVGSGQNPLGVNSDHRAKMPVAKAMEQVCILLTLVFS